MRGMTKSVIVLVSVCLISATMLGLTNFFTKDKIRDNELAATVKALEEVMNGEPIPVPLNLEGVKVNEIVTEVYKAKNGDVAVFDLVELEKDLVHSLLFVGKKHQKGVVSRQGADDLGMIHGFQRRRRGTCSAGESL